MLEQYNIDRSVSHFAVFGNPVQHSKSPLIHSLFAEQFDIALKYQAILVAPADFNDAVKEFASLGGKGLNITVPFKEQACMLCDELSQRAITAGSVNTIWFGQDDTVYGDTTDGIGLINDLTLNNRFNLTGKSILILGAGGTVKSIMEPLMQQQPARVHIANRTVSKAEEIQHAFADTGDIVACGYEELGDVVFDIIINATSLSLQGKVPAIPDKLLAESACCYDLMYSDGPTAFMQWAREQGAVLILDGLGMLVEQAAKAFQIWHGVAPQTKPVIEALRSR